MSTSEVNVNTGTSATYTDILNKTAIGIVAAGDPLAWTYQTSTWGGQALVHHLIPNSVMKDSNVATFFELIREKTMGAPGRTYVFDGNNLNNLMVLPTTETVEPAAAIPRPCIPVIPQITSLTTNLLKKWRLRFEMTISKSLAISANRVIRLILQRKKGAWH